MIILFSAPSSRESSRSSAAHILRQLPQACTSVETRWVPESASPTDRSPAIRGLTHSSRHSGRPGYVQFGRQSLHARQDQNLCDGFLLKPPSRENIIAPGKRLKLFVLGLKVDLPLHRALNALAIRRRLSASPGKKIQRALRLGSPTDTTKGVNSYAKPNDEKGVDIRSHCSRD